MSSRGLQSASEKLMHASSFAKGAQPMRKQNRRIKVMIRAQTPDPCSGSHFSIGHLVFP
jgi:hypothetical protein